MKRRWWNPEPLDQAGMRTLFLGLMIGFLVYGASYGTKYVFPPGQAEWWAVGLNLASIVFTVSWFIAVRRGFRLGKAHLANRAERRAKDHLKAEREKKRKLLR